MTVTQSTYSIAIIPANPLVSAVLAVLFLYLVVRHFLLVLMVMDVVLGWLRRFRWFPGEGRRGKVVLHWLIALGLFFGSLLLAGSLGWLTVEAR